MIVEQVKVGQKWSNVTRHQIVEIISTDKDKCWYRILDQDTPIYILDNKKTIIHMNRLYTLIK
jgi:hypothetical protein